jgi:hypothetical protein
MRKIQKNAKEIRKLKKNLKIHRKIQKMRNKYQKDLTVDCIFREKKKETLQRRKLLLIQ